MTKADDINEGNLPPSRQSQDEEKQVCNDNNDLCTTPSLLPHIHADDSKTQQPVSEIDCNELDATDFAHIKKITNNRLQDDTVSTTTSSMRSLSQRIATETPLSMGDFGGCAGKASHKGGLRRVTSVSRQAADRYKVPSYGTSKLSTNEEKSALEQSIVNSKVAAFDRRHSDSLSLTTIELEMQQRGKVYVWLNSVPCVGIIITVVSSIMFGISMASVKKGLQLQPGMSGIQMTFSRSVVMAFITGILCAFKGQTLWIPRGERLVNAARALFGGAACIGLYTAMKFISVADASAISFSSPLWTTVMARIVFKEPLMVMQFFSLPASLVGMLIIARPQLFGFIGLDDGSDFDERSLIHHDDMNSSLLISSYNQSGLNFSDTMVNGSVWPPPVSLLANHHHHITDITPIGDDTIVGELEEELDTQLYGNDDRIFGILLALTSSFLMAVVYIVLKFRKSTPVQVTVFWLAATSGIVGLILMLTSGRYEWPQNYEVWAYIIGNGIFSWIGQTIFQEAFLFEDAGIISLVRTCDVVVTYILSFFLLHEDIHLSSVVGAIIITLSVVTLMLNKWYKVKRQHELEARQQEMPQQHYQSAIVMDSKIASFKNGK